MLQVSDGWIFISLRQGVTGEIVVIYGEPLTTFNNKGDEVLSAFRRANNMVKKATIT